MDISFVILTWNSEKYIKDCLKILLTELVASTFTFEVFVVDNGSSDNSRDIIQSYESLFPKIIKPVFLNENRGTTYSRNLALKKSSGSYICIMDSDIEMGAGTVQRLIQGLRQNAHVGLMVPKLIYPNGMLQKSTDSFPTVFTKIMRFFLLKQMEEKEREAEHVTKLVEVDYAISAMWMLKREVVEIVGLLDEKIFYAPEDVDYCLRIKKAGFQIVYNPFAVSTHHTQEISRGFKFNKTTFNHVKGLAYYFSKYSTWFKRPELDSIPLGMPSAFVEHQDAVLSDNTTQVAMPGDNLDSTPKAS